jgi:3-hydroxybutyryl-CoA dehydrogenase
VKLEEIKNIAVIGAGIMGHGIAQSFMMKGYSVILNDIAESALQLAGEHIEKNLTAFHEAGLIKANEIESAISRLTTTTNLKQAVESADFIIEAAPEVLSLKQELFENIEDYCPENTVIATNTSSLVLKDIANRVKRKKRLVITHWFNPPHIVPVVEVVKGKETSSETMDLTFRLLQRISKVPVRLNQEIPGFLVNRIQMALLREVLDLHKKGIATTSDIDLAVRGSIGFRLASIGPLMTADLGGIKLWLSVCQNLFPHICSSTTPPETLINLAAEGHDGVKSGKGFYDYKIDFTGPDLDQAIKKRDKEFLYRLKSLYWESES